MGLIEPLAFLLFVCAVLYVIKWSTLDDPDAPQVKKTFVMPGRAKGVKTDDPS